MYKLVFFVPPSHLEQVKSALFTAGAGRIGAYENCCWQVLGLGQFKPMAGAQPFIGDCGALEQVEEFKVELVCEDTCITEAVSALKLTHPYEEPAYEVYRLEDF